MISGRGTGFGKESGVWKKDCTAWRHAACRQAPKRKLQCCV